MVKHLQMEKKADAAVIADAFVDELNKISFAAQKEAFAKTLTNAEREIVLMNSKLKDEVDFQLVGKYCCYTVYESHILVNLCTLFI